MTTRISILGATGSIGGSTIDVLRRAAPGAYQVVAVTAQNRVQDLAEIAKEFSAEIAVIGDPSLLSDLKTALAGTGIDAASGPEGLIEAASRSAARTVAAIVGTAGLPATLAAVRSGSTVLLANKESLVCAGRLLLNEAKRCQSRLIPIDSEHNAILQVLHHPAHVDKLILTASGGPFRQATKEELARVTPEQACRHPNWVMGSKISVDSATMMNKGLELIEAALLFQTEVEKIDVLVHPQSVIHSLVSYTDGSVLAQLGLPDMRTPISHALAWPDRMHLPGVERLDLAKIGRLDFEAPDLDRFPALGVARDAALLGGVGPIAVNAANEVAVAAFLQRRIGFTDIALTAATVLGVMAKHECGEPKSFDDVFEMDNQARALARETLRLAA